MPRPGRKATVPLETIVSVCEELYARSGFVKWTEVAERVGLDNGTIHKRFKDAIKRGDLTPETVERWRSLTARRRITAENAKAKNRRALGRIEITLTPDNFEFVKQQCTKHSGNMTEIVNGIINAARTYS